MADLGSTRVFGRISVSHEAFFKDDVSVDGMLSADAFVGNGEGLTNIKSTSLSGTIGYGNLPFSSGNVSNWNTAYGWGNHANAGYALASRTITAGTGLSGGGNLTANRTLSVTYGTTAGTAAQGNDSRLSNSREWTASTVSQAEAEAGTATTRRAWSSQRVRQNVSAYTEQFTSSEKSKLSGIAAGAQVNVATNLGQSRNATSYTITSSTGNNTVLAAATTSNAGVMAAADKSKLDGIAAGAQVNVGTNLGSSGTGATRTITSSTGSNTSITYSAADVGAVPTGRTISTGTGLTGGGSLAGNRTISLDSTSQTHLSRGNTAYGWGNHASAGYATESYVGAEIDNIEIGGRNLLLSSSEITSWEGVNTISTSSGAFVYTPNYERGLLYQIEARTNDTNLIGKEFGWQFSSILQGKSVILSNQWQKAYCIVPLDHTGALGLRVIDGTGVLELRKTKAEKGNIATDWSPAPEYYTPTSRTITAGTGLSGGGNLTANRTLSVNFGTTAGTSAQGNDSRLSNSREWTASTVSQAEAQAGTATTARKWTAQRVAQSINSLGLKIGTTSSTAKAGNWMPTWANVTGKPSTFTPSSHTHTLSQITDAGSVASINTNASTTNFLRGDGTWVTPPNSNTVTSIRANNTGTYRTGNINLIGGSNVTVSEGTAGQFTITATNTNTTYSAGTGLSLSGTTFTNTAPHVATNLGSSRNATSYTITSSTGSNTTLAAATTSNAGVMTAADKLALANIPTYVGDLVYQRDNWVRDNAGINRFYVSNSASGMIWRQSAVNQIYRWRDYNNNDVVTLHSGNGNFVVTGNVTAYSDIRVKENIEVIPNALDKVKVLNGYTYNRTDTTDEDKRHTGVIAQEVLEVLPEAVIGGPTEEDPDAKYSVAYGNMVGLLIEAIKEQQQTIDTQAKQISELYELVKEKF